MTLSSHQQFYIQKYIHSKFRTGTPHKIVVPPEHSWNLGDKAEVYRPRDQKYTYQWPIIQCVDIGDYNRPGELIISCTTISDYKSQEKKGGYAIKGPFSREDIGLLITSLVFDVTGSFVPEQIGLPPLFTDPSFSNGKKVWMRAQSFVFQPSEHDTPAYGITMKRIEPLLIASIERGFRA
jgi:hypothetical protein